MTDTLTMDQIQDAQASGLAGTSAVLAAMDGRLTKLADAAARRMDQSKGSRFYDCREDFRQDAAVAMFEVLPRFKGATTDAFYAFMWDSIENVLKDKVRADRNCGADADAVKIFGQMLAKTENDPHQAAKMAQSVPPKGRRLSADRAEAARLAWQGTSSLDAPQTLSEGSNTKFGATAGYDVTFSGAENVVSELGIPEDLVKPEDISSEQRREKHAIVNAILAAMTKGQADSLRYTFGIGGYQTFGRGDSGDLPGMADAMGVSVISARNYRIDGFKGFAKRYIKATITDPDVAAAWAAEAKQNLSHGGRK